MKFETRARRWLVGLCVTADLVFLLPRLLSRRIGNFPYLWTGLGALLDAALVTLCWLLLYLLWEKRWAGGVRNGLSFWTAVGGAVARLLVCALPGNEWLRGGASRLWLSLRLLPLCFLAAAVTAVWRSAAGRDPARKRLWLWLSAALALRLLGAALDTALDPILPRLPLIAAHAGILVCILRKKGAR